MQLSFFKYHGTGNDFILIDDRMLHFPAEDHQLIRNLCHRRFGIGADGLILLQNHADFDFQMRYFNADGFESTMCGNGGRCTVAFAAELGLLENEKTEFIAVDGVHQAEISADRIRLRMSDVTRISELKNYFLIDSGSPHLVIGVENLQDLNVVEEGRKLRYNKSIAENGVNVNFIHVVDNDSFKIRTYERGVEDETLSCGTGSVASAIAFSIMQGKTEAEQHFRVHAPGGLLEVSFIRMPERFVQVYLTGPAVRVFEGKISI
ncbi:MAG TPA: diaminopimelate epimerase [Bacteroidia bacterium]|nr:diaminopimelate epimerase [Bacteroidia bacterium]